MKVHYSAIMCQTSRKYRKIFLFGYMPEEKCTHDEERRVYIQFLRNDSMFVKLVALTEGCTKKCEKKWSGPYHICYECEDMDKEIEAMQGKGFMLLRPSAPAPAIQDHCVAFLYSGAAGMIELVEM